jgi:diadenosine tetraphosphate (Ap4A) HIT family hydrolase
MEPTTSCYFCIQDPSQGNDVIPPKQIIGGYKYWWLLLQPEAKRNKTKQAAGMLVSKRHIETVSLATADEAAELISIVKDASRKLCEKVGSQYTDQETVGYNQGSEAGQTIKHAHVHVLPVSESDPAELKVRGGIGGAFEALRKERLSKD